MVDIVQELDNMVACRKKRAGVLMVKAMAEYFASCAELNDLGETLKTQQRLKAPTRDTEEQMAELRGKGELLEELVPELFEVYEDTPGLKED